MDRAGSGDLGKGIVMATEQEGPTDHDYESEPVCPYCGHREMDAWEISFGGAEGSTEITCGQCERDYFCEKSITVYYSTRALKEAK